MPNALFKRSISSDKSSLISKAKRAVVVHQDETYGDSVFIIPSTVVYKGETYNVTNVERVYLRGSHSISVILSEGITHIGEDAFVACCLTEITIPKSIVSIGKLHSQDVFRDL